MQMQANNEQLQDSAHQLVLFVSGGAPRSLRARSNLQGTLDRLGIDGEQVEVVDLLENPRAGIQYSVFAAPALLRNEPGSEPQLLYGDLADTTRLEQFLSDLAARD